MDYIELINDLFPPAPSPNYIPPSLTYGPNGYSFGSSHFANNEQAAKEARAEYWSNHTGTEPLALDSDLEV